MKTVLLSAAAFALSAVSLAFAAPLETPPTQKPRVVITADPELDDSNSLIRYLLYTTDYQTEGLIYASSQFHWKGDGRGTKLSVPGREYTRFGLKICPCTSWRWDPKERFIDDAVDAYAKAYSNLRVHDASYPTPETLKAKIRWGNVEFDGEMAKDTPGSELIKSLLLDDDESPIYLHAWGGQSTIARALKSIEERYQGTAQWEAIRAKVIRKAVIHPSGDQDDTYAKYIRPHWPEIRYRVQAGGVPMGYGTQRTVSLEDAAYFSPEWTHKNVSSQGPLGALYRVWGDGKQMVKADIFDYFGNLSGQERTGANQAGLHRVDPGAGQGLVPERRRHANVPEPDRQWPAWLSRRQLRRLGRLSTHDDRALALWCRSVWDAGAGGRQPRRTAPGCRVRRLTRSWRRHKATLPHA